MKPGYEHLLQRAEQLIARIEAVLPQALPEPDWSSSTAFRYRKRSVGRSSLEPVLHIGAMRLDDLKEMEPQKEKIRRNTLQFVNGALANNVLLTGARGTGKSSLIRACLNEYAQRGLRLIEVDKADLATVPATVPQRQLQQPTYQFDLENHHAVTQSETQGGSTGTNKQRFSHEPNPVGPI